MSDNKSAIVPNTEENNTVHQEEDPDDAEIALLDSAFEDFKIIKEKHDKVKKDKVTPEASSSSKESSKQCEQWSEEYLKKITEDVQKNVKDLCSRDSSQLDSILESIMNGTNSGTAPPHLPPSFSSQLNGAGDEKSLQEELSATIEQLTSNLNNLPTNMTSNNSSSGLPDAHSMMPMLEDIMQTFLSKDVLYPVFSQTCEKYPEWLESNKETLSETDFNNYSKQYDLMSKIVQEFDKEKSDDSQTVKKERFNVILELLQQMQSYGQPPTSLVGEQNFPTTAIPSMDPAQCCIM